MPLSARSLFFTPGHSAEKIAKALRVGADVTVVDWEDAVPVDQKAAARDVTAAALHQERPGTFVRVNPPGTAYFEDDIAAALRMPFDGLVLPKVEHADVVLHVRSEAAAQGRDPLGLVLGIETARGVADCGDILRAGATAAYFGAEDYIADLGGVRTELGLEVLYARSHTVLTARVNDVVAIDQAVVAYRNDELFTADALAGRSMGYQGKICIHPRQVELAHQAFTPTAEEVEHARRVLALESEGVASLDGQMVDAVHLAMARGVLARAGLAVPEAAEGGSGS